MFDIKFETIGSLNEHLVRHANTEKRCYWHGCANDVTDDLHKLEIHVLHHLYNVSDNLSCACGTSNKTKAGLY